MHLAVIFLAFLGSFLDFGVGVDRRLIANAISRKGGRMGHFQEKQDALYSASK